MNGTARPDAVLVHLASGIGNVVLATPLLVALSKLNLVVDVLLDADYPETADLLRDWSLVRAVYPSAVAPSVGFDTYRYLLPAVPPFYWRRYARLYARLPRALARPPDARFYENEQAYYLDFARRLGYVEAPGLAYCLPIATGASPHASAGTVVLAPGCKTGEMASKRWTGFPQLAEWFADVALVGTRDDLGERANPVRTFPGHVRSFIDTLTLRETVELMASAGVVVGNDSGLSHAAAATGTPTVMLFGPTPHLTLGPLPPNVTILRTGLPCEPCWLSARLHACGGRVDCLRQLAVERVVESIRGLAVLNQDLAAKESSTGCGDTDRPAAPALVAGGNERGGPLVSCIMPTSNRRVFVPGALSRFLQQDYPNRELVVLDDGTDFVQDLIPNDVRIRYERLERKLALGAKRNLACERARGELIVHWDDDDWMAPWRLSYQVRAMIDHPGAEVCGLARLLFYDPAQDRAWEYVYCGSVRSWVAGGTMCYRKAHWHRHRFSDVREGEDTRFVWSTPPHQVLALADSRFYIARIHPRNTSPKHPNDSHWRPYPIEHLRHVAAGWEALRRAASAR